MSHGPTALAAFHRLGDRSRLPKRAAVPLRPALFGAYHDLARLRGDFPLLIGARPGDGPWLETWSDRIDALARESTRPGAADEPARRQLLALEQAVRHRVQRDGGGPLADLLVSACDELCSDDPDNVLARRLADTRAALPADAEVAGFDADVALKVLRRAWLEAEHAKANLLNRRIGRLAQRLSDILRADRARSRDARKAAALRRALGGADRTVFDFQAMARVLRSAPLAEPLPAARRHRIQSAIDTLRAQRFTAAEGSARPAYDFEFDDCAAALEAFRERLPAMRDLVRAIALAELEIENQYDEARHDAFFDKFGDQRLGAADMGQFPSFLLHLRDPDTDERAHVLALLEMGMPFKIIVQYTDINGDISSIEGQMSVGRWAQHLARMALGLDEVFVLQAPAARIFPLKDSLLHGMSLARPALFSLFAGEDYLISAAAAESRAFPCLVYDPEAGDSQAQRYRLSGNPRPERNWPRHPLAFETREQAPETVETAFTLADFLAADRRFAACFASADEETLAAESDNQLVPVADYLGLDDTARTCALPCVLLIDGENRLRRAVVDEKVIEATRRSLGAWRSLQELCGIRNSHVEAAMAQRPAGGAATAASTAPATTPEPESETAPEPSAAPQPIAEADRAEPEAPTAPDDPWIETIRCTTCNECTQINSRMFAYNADQRAYIADPDAGTYRELVQAAETCQVAIIHPGRPRNPDEPGLDELLKRAEPFL